MGVVLYCLFSFAVVEKSFNLKCLYLNCYSTSLVKNSPDENSGWSKEAPFSYPFHVSIYIENLVSYQKVQSIKPNVAIILDASVVCMLMRLTQVGH